ncbi:Tn7-like element transposition protein TnsE [Lysinibacillus irui]|uniref:Tn7-like element transposition protein TnsE n=1 Tax=Lysinibacillus irui TaxID=2998077 RepID=A0AAJ5RMP4_9BACI|nr:Tn7-like element transposition protein TnsE [Lysinibacillus irui]WDV06734.1 Tn7-like element transposition protein TnsE [Lysinibacillus irui]
MSDQQVKLNNWPFKEGEQAQLIWISSPFKYEKKVMMYAYFRANGKTEKLLVDWGTLPALVIQHYYIDGDIRKSIPPKGTEAIVITIYPNMVDEYEKKWNIIGTNDKDISRSFIVKQGIQNYILPLIEVVRSILAPNRFLLYRLFEANSFPQYFIENYDRNKIHLDFSSQYHRKYTQSNYLCQLVWLLTNKDLRNVFENVAYTFNNSGNLNFDWSIRQPITIKAIVKPNATGGTVLRVVSMKNKQIPYSEISFEHPEVVQSERSNEPKKYTLHTKKNIDNQQEELMLDEKVEGTTDNFDSIEMNNQKHEYVKLPKITKICRNLNKKRDFEDEHTKKHFVNDQGKRSTADVGGNKLARGLEQHIPTDIQYGELGEFIKVVKVLQGYNEVQSINIIQGSLKEFSETKRFVYLSDNLTERKYVIAEIALLPNTVVSMIEVEREHKALSTLIVVLNKTANKKYLYHLILDNLVDNSGTWDKDLLSFQCILYITLRHVRKNPEHQAKRFIDKIFNII